MKKLYYYNEFQYNEKVNWKKIRTLGGTVSDYAMWASLALLLGLKVTPEDIKRYPIRSYIANSIENLDDYGLNSILEKAKKSVINKVLQQDNILNKKELISKINNVIVKEKERDTKSYFSEKDAIMYYFNFKENDYIVVSKGETTSEYNTFIHELNHLVDRHKKTKVDIVPSFILKDFDEKQFLDFGDRFFPNLIQDRKDVTREDIIYETWFFFQNNKEYLISEPELYARLSHMKSYLIDEGYMKKDEKVTKEIVSKFLEDFKQLEFKTFDYLEKLEQIDFIFYLPFIDWDKTDEFNLIVSKEFKLPESYV